MQQQSSFLKKLQCILEDSNNSHIIQWLNEDQFVILNQSMFVTEILPQYFRHKNMQSFIRLNTLLSSRLLYKYKFRYFKKEKTRIISHYGFKKSYILWNEFKFTKTVKTQTQELEDELQNQKKLIQTLKEQQFCLIKQINIEVNRYIALQIIMAEFRKQQTKFFNDGQSACLPLVTSLIKLQKGFKEKTGYLSYLYQEFVPQKYQFFPWSEGEKIPDDLYDQISLSHFSPLQFKFM